MTKLTRRAVLATGATLGTTIAMPAIVRAAPPLSLR